MEINNTIIFKHNNSYKIVLGIEEDDIKTENLYKFKTIESNTTISTNFNQFSRASTKLNTGVKSFKAFENGFKKLNSSGSKKVNSNSTKLKLKGLNLTSSPKLLMRKNETNNISETSSNNDEN